MPSARRHRSEKRFDAQPPVRNPGQGPLADGLPVDEIYGIEQALDLPAEWPAGRQGRLYQAAFDACFGASVGVVDVEEACRAFSAFCRAGGLMARDMMWRQGRAAASVGYAKPAA